MRIVIVDDHVLMRRGLVYIVKEGFPDADVVEAESNAVALEGMRERPADLALVGVRMPDLDGLSLLGPLKLEWPDVPVIMLSTYENAVYVKRALSAGAAGYLLKDATPEFLRQAITAAISGGGNLVSPRVINTLFRDLEKGGHSGDVAARWADYQLSERERQILVLLADGLSNREIAKDLFLSEKTVKAHLIAIYRKLGVVNRTQAAMMSMQFGVGPEPEAVGGPDVPDIGG